MLTSGGTTTFAVCTTCADGGSDLRRPWVGLAGWLGAIVLVLAAVAAALALARG